MEGLDLVRAVDDKIKSIRTRQLDLSFNELLDMYVNDELIINPDYQRLFRWSEGKQSRFIESLLLELPVPPIFVIELEEGTYELIDGLQRISSYLHFRGKLKDENNKEKEPLELVDCDIVPELNGLTHATLPRPLEIKLKRNFIRVEILRKESDSRLRYYMFKRLNTGGEQLSEQEIRNSTIRLLDSRFNELIVELSRNEDFKLTIDNLTDTKISAKYDQELVLRFLAFKNDVDGYDHDVDDFLTEYMEKATLKVVDGTYDLKDDKDCFEKAFAILAKVMGGQVFAGLSTTGKPSKGFLIYHFEAFSLGIVPFLEKIDTTNTNEIESIKKAFIELKDDSDFQKLTKGGGKNYRRLLKNRIKMVSDKMSELYG